MIKSNLHKLMGEKRIKSILQLHNETKISRRALTNLYNDNFKAIDMDTLTTLCEYFNCDVGDLLYLDKGQ